MATNAQGNNIAKTVANNAAVNANLADKNTVFKVDFFLVLKMLVNNLMNIPKGDNKYLNNQIDSNKENRQVRNRLDRSHKIDHANTINSTKMVASDATGIYVIFGTDL